MRRPRTGPREPAHPPPVGSALWATPAVAPTAARRVYLRGDRSLLAVAPLVSLLMLSACAVYIWCLLAVRGRLLDDCQLER
jgi:hypothetical protein